MLIHLFFWKYATWAISLVQSLWSDFLGGQYIEFHLPIGISFYTLQAIAYFLDFGWGKTPFLDVTEYGVFKLFFSPLIAGPILRGKEFTPQIRNLRRPLFEDVKMGLALFILGFGKKVLIADKMAGLADPVFDSPNSYVTGSLWIGLVAYAVQIWADFSGYTDMAIGTAQMLGIRLPQNFFSPYLSRSPTEFWNRWHVTLSRWIRDYLFTPMSLAFGELGGWGLALTVAVTMSLSGLWHGASFNFVAWGIYHGCLLVIDGFLRSRDYYERLRLPKLMKSFFGCILTFLLVLVGWVLFRGQSYPVIGTYLAGLCGFSNGASEVSVSQVSLNAMLSCIILQVGFYRDLKKGRLSLIEKAASRAGAWIQRKRGVQQSGAGTALGCGVTIGLLIILLTLVLFSALPSGPPKRFIYFQF